MYIYHNCCTCPIHYKVNVLALLNQIKIMIADKELSKKLSNSNFPFIPGDPGLPNFVLNWVQ